MNVPLLEVQPRELQFIFELKKQSSCEVRLANNTFHSVAFKIKTTSPKKYCVRPNVGIVLPKSTCEFIVTMQAPKAVPSELLCKDKFLIQSTVVPVGTTDKDITPLLFNKAEGKLVEEIKLRVVLMSPPQSPVLSPINGVLKQGPPLYDPSVLGDQILSKIDNTAKVHSVATNEKDVEMKPKKDVNDVQELKPEKNIVLPTYDFFNDEVLNLGKDEKIKQVKEAIDDKFAKDVELPPPVNRVQVTFIDQISKDAEFPPPQNAVKDAFIDQLTKDTKSHLPNNTEKDAIIDERVKGADLSLPDKAGKDSINDTTMKDAELSTPENVVKCADFVTVNAVKELKLVSDIEEMKSKLNHLETKLNEAESIISNLTEERKLSIQESINLQEQLVLLRSRTNAKRVQVGFPLLFVVMVALVSIFLGYHSHR